MDAFDRVRAELKALAPRTASAYADKTVAVLLPCHNAEATIAGIVDGFRRALPQAEIHVYDDNSTDRTAHTAGKAGAAVRREPFLGRGNAVRRMFADIDADIYVLADVGSTCHPALADKLIERLVKDNLDMVVGARVGEMAASIPGLFGAGFSDILSGYRVVSRRFAKSFPAAPSDFEIEAELSIHALDLKIAAGEVPLPHSTEPTASASRLGTVRSGCKMLWTIGMMYRALRPFRFYGVICAALALVSVALGYPVVETYLETGTAPQLPTAVLAMGVLQLAFLSLACGLIVEAVSDGRREAKRMRYLHLSSVVASGAPQWQEPRVVSSQIL